MANYSGDTDASGSQRQGGRGPTLMTSVLQTRALGQRRRLELDARGAVVGDEESNWTSYLGVCARNHVPITIRDWRHLTEQQRSNIWADLRSAFEWDESRLTRKKVLSDMSKKFRDWRSRLYNDYMFGDEKGKDPCQKYHFLTRETWEAFVEYRQTEEEQERRKQNKQRAEMNKYFHSLSRGGYTRLKRRVMEARLHALRSEAQAQGLDPSSITMEHVPVPTRTEMWVDAMKRKSTGEFITEESASVGQRVDELTQLAKEGKFVEEGRKDILAEALGKAEHPGRVRGVGKGKGIKDVFGTSSRSRSSGGAAMAQDQMKEYVSGEIVRAKQDMLGTFIGVLKSVATPEPDGYIRLNVDSLVNQLGYQEAHSMPISPQDPRSFKSSCGEKDTFQDVEQPCHLFVEDEDEGERVMVAVGMVTSSRVLHNRNLPDEEVRVRIVKVKVGWAPLPIPPDDDITQVRQAKGTFVAWPRELVDMTLGTPEVSPASRVSKAKGAAPTVPSVTSDAGEYLSHLREVLATFQSLPLGVGAEVVGRHFHLIILPTMLQELLAVDMLDMQWMMVWILYLYDLSVMANIENYGFIAPAGFLEHEAPASRVQYIADRMVESQKSYLLLPILRCAHWNLLLICPRIGTVYLFDPIGGRPASDVKHDIGIAYSEYIFRGGPYVGKRRRTMQWINHACPHQRGHTECGYFVMRYMLEMVSHGLTEEGIDQLFNSTMPYSVEQIDEIREELAKYTLQQFP